MLWAIENCYIYTRDYLTLATPATSNLSSSVQRSDFNMRHAYSIAKANLMSWKLLSVQKKLASVAPNWAVVGTAMLRKLDWLMVSKSSFYSSRRPNCQLDLWDTAGKGKYPVAALSARVASYGTRPCPSKSEEMLRYKGSAVTPLSQILECPHSSIIYSAIVQRPPKL